LKEISTRAERARGEGKERRQKEVPSLLVSHILLVDLVFDVAEKLIDRLLTIIIFEGVHVKAREALLAIVNHAGNRPLTRASEGALHGASTRVAERDVITVVRPPAPKKRSIKE